MDLNFDKTYSTLLKSMAVCRVHPDIKKDYKWFLQVGIMSVFYTLYFICLLNNILIHDIPQRDYCSGCLHSVLIFGYLDVCLRLIIYITKNQSIKNMLTLMREDFQIGNSMPDNEKEIILKYATKGNVLTIQWIILGFLTIGGLFFKAPIQMIRSYMQGEFKGAPATNLVYPDFIEELNGSEYVVFYIAQYFILLPTFVTSGLIFMTFMPLGHAFMLHACGQLEIITLRLNCLFAHENNDSKQRLKDIIKRTQHVYRLVEIIEDCFSLVYEFMLRISTIELPITLYAFIQSVRQGKPITDFVGIMIGSILTNSSTCYFGDLLIQKGEDVRMAVYQCGWEKHYDLSTRKTLLIMLTRMTRPVAVGTVLQTMCLQTLSEMFQQSYAIFNIMNAVLIK